MFESLVDQATAQLAPHAEALNATINGQGARVEGRLASIEAALSTGRGDYVSEWYRLLARGTAASAGIVELGPINSQLVVPRNQIWLVQWAVYEGATAAITITNPQNDQLLYIPAGSGNVSVGGNVAFLPGEHVYCAVEKGIFNLSLQIIRQLLPTPKHATQLGPKSEYVAGNPTHDPKRDEITAIPGPWVQTPPELRDVGGAPPIISTGDPTSV
jgi:hypothetical protein